jgi:predicted Zn-dependent peptidase
MSSRLFQTVREKRGLCYRVYSFGSSYIDTGLFAVYAALGRETEREAVAVIKEELKKFKDGVTPEELTRAREQIKANILMSLEQTGSRMHRLGKNELYLGYIPELDEIINYYDRVTEEDIRTLAQELLDFEAASFSAVGKVGDVDYYRGLLS